MRRTELPRPRSRGPRPAPALAALGLALLPLACETPSSPPARAPDAAAPHPPRRAVAPAGAPSFVVVELDDLSAADWHRMPRTLARPGRLFWKIVNQPVCCPARASTQTGMLAQNTRLIRLDGRLGGMRHFIDRGLDTLSAAFLLQRAGWTTAYLGKFMNAYNSTTFPDARAAAGWDVWHGLYGKPHYFGYTMVERGMGRDTIATYGKRPEEYLTDLLARRAAAFLRAHPGGPVLLWVGAYAPHAPAEPAPRHAGTHSTAEIPPEAIVEQRGGAAWLLRRDTLSKSERGTQTALHRRRLETYASVEELVDSIFVALEQTGRRASTYVLVTSDNGFHFGVHQGKNTYYDTDVRVPLYVVGPGVLPGESDDLAMNIDLAPTLLALAGLPAPAYVDGRSLADALRGAPLGRNAARIEHGGGLDQQKGCTAVYNVPRWDGVRTRRYTYVELCTGERILFDNELDPSQRTNRWPALTAAERAQWHAWLAPLLACKGAACRAAEDRPVP